MAAPKGNQNAKGKKTGRKSAFQEKADAATLHRMFFDPHETIDIKDLITKGNYSAKDAFMALVLGGKEKPLIAMFNKVFPDKLLTEHDVTKNLGDIIKQTMKNAERYPNKFTGRNIPRPPAGSGSDAASVSGSNPAGNGEVSEAD